MRRRNFLIGCAALGTTPILSSIAQEAEKAFVTNVPERAGQLKITDVQVWRLTGRREGIRGAHRQHQVRPLHIYPEYRPEPYRESQITEKSVTKTSALYAKILTDAGLEGIYGPIDSEAAVVVDRQLKPFLNGKEPLAGETLWDKMYRLNRHSRASHFMMGISAVDNALWDLRGRFFNAPVYRLLGGPSRDAVVAYGSCLGFSAEPAAAHARSIQMKEIGFRHQKWFLAYGPGDGAKGLQKNVELVRTLREAVGDDVELMFDAFMGWDLQYAKAWAKQVEKYRPRWIEEAFAPDKMGSFVQLRRSTSIPVATGEHFYGRWEVNRFLRAGAIDVVQADPEWCGGVSELVKICTLASVYDAHVIPHGHNLHTALHVVASQPPMTCPMIEYLYNKMKYYYFFEKHHLRPVNGTIVLPQRAGFGIELDDSKIEEKKQVHWT